MAATDPELVFPLDSAIWQISRERSGLIYGPAAAILQVAHPRVAQGVAQHSRFQSDTLGRLRRTLDSDNRIAFGPRAEADAMGARMHRTHQEVKGETAPGMPGRNQYSAFEPDLLLWVLATLVWGAVEGYTCIHEKPSLETRERFYRDMRIFGRYFGLSEEVGPQDWDGFEAYFAEQIHQPWLGNHEVCREVTRAIVHPRDHPGTFLLGLGVDFLPLETVPSPVRENLGLASTPWSRFRMQVFRKVFPPFFRGCPKRWRFHPEAYQAWRRHRK
ncbi:MAG: oxygenase MpaB family protein [Verrucomicrobiota bacterium]